jgi:hypothetical protein
MLTLHWEYNKETKTHDLYLTRKGGAKVFITYIYQTYRGNYFHDVDEEGPLGVFLSEEERDALHLTHDDIGECKKKVEKLIFEIFNISEK